MEAEKRREYLEFFFLLALAIVIALTIVKFVGQRTVVNGSSMVPTLHDKDQLIVYKLGYQFNEPQKGDIVVVWIPPEKRINQSEDLYIKRVIAKAGDTIEVKDKQVYINDEPLNENHGINLEGIGVYTDFPRSVVPPGHAFVMGDNRINSRDSRELGFIPYTDIKGKAVFRFWPIDSFGKLK